MANAYGSTAVEKVTFNMPLELKEQVIALRDELKLSLSAIYNEAISNYIKQKELEKWQKGVDMALHDEAYIALAKELGSESGDLYEY